MGMRFNKENGVVSSGLRFQRRLQRGAGGETLARFLPNTKIPSYRFLSHRSSMPSASPNLEVLNTHHSCRQLPPFLSSTPLKLLPITVTGRERWSGFEMTRTGDGWSQICRKRGRKSARRPTHGELPGLGPNPNPGLSLDAIQKYHERVSQDWIESDSWGALQATLRDAFPACNRPSITKAICLGPGPFDPANDNASIRRTAHMQTEAFRSIVASLGRALHLLPSK